MGTWLRYQKQIYHFVSTYNKPCTSQIIKIINKYSLIIPILGTSIIAFYIVKDANWILGDDNQFWTSTLVGKFFHTWNDSHRGRFWPLGLLEYNIFLPFGDVPYAYYSWNALKFIVTLFCLFLLLHTIQKQHIPPAKDKNYFFIACALSLFLLSLELYHIYAEIIFPESSLIPLLGFFLFFHVRGYHSKKRKDAIFAWIFASVALYFKEPTVAFVLVVALTELLLIKSKRKKYLLSLVLSALLFLALYYILVYRNAAHFYNTGRTGDISRFRLLEHILARHTYLYVLFFISLARVPFIFVKGKKIQIYDGMLWGACAFWFSYIILRLNASYYFTPVYMMSFPALFFYTITWYHKYAKSIGYKIFLLVCMTLFFVIMYDSSRLTHYIASITEARREFFPAVEHFIKQFKTKNIQLYYYLPPSEKEDFHPITQAFVFKDSDFSANIINSLDGIDYDQSIILLTAKAQKNEEKIYRLAEEHKQNFVLLDWKNGIKFLGKEHIVKYFVTKKIE